MPRALHDQVVVITGASSGIGRATALLFGRHGATVVLAARNETALNEVVAEVEAARGRASAVVTDVAEFSEVERLAQAAVQRFGRIDTWINNAGVGTFGSVEQSSVEELERVIQVNLLSQVYGVKAVLPYMITARRGGIINVGSVLSKRSVPLLASYCASKHGVKGFSEALRVELQVEHPGISVTLILPSAVNTPFFEHARSKLGVLPKPIPPVYKPDAVAEAIVFAAEHPRPEITVGGGKLFEIGESISPRLLDRYLSIGRRGYQQQRSDRPDDGVDNLDAPLPGLGSAEGDFSADAKPYSLYTRHLEQYPYRKVLAGGAVAGSALLLLRRVGR
jgi:short-subunit dehydrogenase